MANKPSPVDDAVLWLRTQRNGQVWCIKVGAQIISTGLPLERQIEAEKAVAIFNAAMNALPRPNSPSAEIKVGVALQWALSQQGIDPDDDGRQRGRKAAVASRINILMEFWSDLMIGEVAPATQMQYMHLRIQGLKPFDNRSCVSAATALADMVLFRTTILGYIKHFSLTGRPIFKLDKIQPSTQYSITRSDLARLLLTTLGFVWDQDSKRMVKSGTIKAIAMRRVKRRHLARMILISIYTASTCECVTKLKWEESDTGDQSYIDLDGEPALLHRLGVDAAAGKQAGVPLPINWRIAAHLRRWDDLDSRTGKKFIVSIGDGSDKLSSNPFITFRKMVKEANLPPTITMRSLPHSAAEYLARRKDVIPRSSAILLGMPQSTFMERYGHLRPQYQEAVMAAFRKKPSSIA